MLEEVTTLFNLPVFTNRGVQVGAIDNVIMDTSKHQIIGVVVESTNEALVEGGISPKERTLLIHLRDSLGVSESDAEAIELELQTNQPSLA